MKYKKSIIIVSLILLCFLVSGCCEHYVSENDLDKYIDESTITSTCEESGTVEYVCPNCERTVQTDYPALGHSWEMIEDTNTATCVSGTAQFECTRCHKIETKQTNAIQEHNYKFVETIKPGLYSDGYTKYVCEVCGTEKKDNKIQSCYSAKSKGYSVVIQKLKNSLKDPDSLIVDSYKVYAFENKLTGEYYEYICFMILYNAKNSFGGYAGKTYAYIYYNIRTGTASFGGGSMNVDDYNMHKL